MRWRRGSGDPESAGQEPDVRTAEEEVPSAPGWTATVSTGAVALAVTAVRWGAWGLVVAGPLLGAMALFSQPDAGAAAARPDRSASAGQRGAGVGPSGFAELYVRSYLSGAGARELAAFYPPVGDAEGSSAEERSRAGVEAVAATRVRRVSAGYWSVTVAARPRVAGSGEQDGQERDEAAGTRYFQVPVRETKKDGAGLVALSWPAEVAAPRAPGKLPSLAYGSAQEAVRSHPLVRTLQNVFGAYLVEGALERYTAPGTALAPVRPAPYTQVTVRRVAQAGTNSPMEAQNAPRDGEWRRLLVEVEARTPPVGEETARSWPLTYAVELRARDGRWEVTDLHAAPALESPNAREDAHEGEAP